MMNKIILMISVSLGSFALGQVTSSPLPPPVENQQNLLIDVNKIYDNPDYMPAFPEGIMAFKTKFEKAIILDSVQPENADNALKGMISFTIERDGSMTDVQVKGVNENFNVAVKKAVRSIKDKWKPGKHKGEIVRSRFRIPLTMYKK